MDMSVLDPRSQWGRDSLYPNHCSSPAWRHGQINVQYGNKKLMMMMLWNEHEPDKKNSPCLGTPRPWRALLLVPGDVAPPSSPVTRRSSSWSCSMYSSICSFSCSRCSANSDRSSWFLSICCTMCRLPLEEQSRGVLEIKGLCLYVPNFTQMTPRMGGMSGTIWEAPWPSLCFLSPDQSPSPECLEGSVLSLPSSWLWGSYILIFPFYTCLKSATHTIMHLLPVSV